MSQRSVSRVMGGIFGFLASFGYFPFSPPTNMVVHAQEEQSVPPLSGRQIILLRDFVNATQRLSKNPNDHDAYLSLQNESKIVTIIDAVSTAVVNHHTGAELKLDGAKKLRQFRGSGIKILGGPFINRAIYNFKFIDKAGNKLDWTGVKVNSQVVAQAFQYARSLVGGKHSNDTEPYECGYISQIPIESQAEYLYKFRAFLISPEDTKDGARVALDEFTERFVQKHKYKNLEDARKNLETDVLRVFSPGLEVFEGYMPDEEATLGNFVSAELYRDLDKLVGVYQKEIKGLPLPQTEESGYALIREGIDLVHAELLGFIRGHVFRGGEKLLDVVLEESGEVWDPSFNNRLGELYPNGKVPGRIFVDNQGIAETLFDNKDTMGNFLRLIACLPSKDTAYRAEQDLIKGDSFQSIVDNAQQGKYWGE